jgi:hypothetical protein
MKPLILSILVSMAVAGCSANAVPLHNPYAGQITAPPVMNECKDGTCGRAMITSPAIDSSTRDVNTSPILYRSIFIQGL